MCIRDRVHGREPDVCHQIDVLQKLEDQLADVLRGHFVDHLAPQTGLDLADEAFQKAEGYVPLRAGAHQSLEQLVRTKGLRGAVPLDYGDGHFFKLLVRRVASPALRALTPPPDGLLPLDVARIHDLAFGVLAVWTVHAIHPPRRRNHVRWWMRSTPEHVPPPSGMARYPQERTPSPQVPREQSPCLSTTYSGRRQHSTPYVAVARRIMNA